MKLVSLLPVLLLIGGIAAKTNFKVNGTFYCDYNAWCFFVTLWEEDTSEYWNDVIDTMGTKCVFGRHSYFYELDGTEYEDGPFDMANTSLLQSTGTKTKPDVSWTIKTIDYFLTVMDLEKHFRDAAQRAQREKETRLARQTRTKRDRAAKN
ncbi:Protein CBG10212 [Caenorhabditis briggsae]|uniref:Protein CBG10212 n=1 Tax=Caenorhabditis briggsae TaxID=6238 RepID=A8XAU6_CAEBR|nr:Protein CBG10212 [Caenorhabditis briggsae]CAP29761.2 Protein CBG10212 [Caenorhabditis briggsae]